MEWWKLFSGTFILIFLAELGDKTQLAAMAKTADSPDNSMAKWVVFLAASAALVASTFIAVFLGHTLKALVPDERYIKLAAGSLFVVFGVMILYETYRSYYPSAAPRTAAVADTRVLADTQPGLVGELALRAAIDFEALAGARYRSLAAGATQRLSGLLLDLAREEDSHLARLRGIPDADAGIEAAGGVPSPTANSIRTSAGDPGTLAELIRHEEATAAFYQSLADRAIIPSLKNVFSKLAREEQRHASRLSEAAGKWREESGKA